MASPQKQVRNRFRTKIYQSGKYKEIFKRDKYICFYCGIRVYSTDQIWKEVNDEQEKWYIKFLNKKISYKNYLKVSDTVLLFKKYYNLHRLDLATIDHIIPISKKEDNSPENLTTSCKSCNSRKKDKYD